MRVYGTTERMKEGQQIVIDYYMYVNKIVHTNGGLLL
jgi:hypothetical protein